MANVILENINPNMLLQAVRANQSGDELYYNSFSSRNFTIINGAFIDAKRYVRANCGDSFVAKGALYIGHQVALRLNSVVGAVELVANFAIVALGAALCAATKCQNTFLLKHTVALFGSLSNNIVTALNVGITLQNSEQLGPSSHIENVVLKQVRLVLSLLVVKTVASSFFESLGATDRARCRSILNDNLNSCIREGFKHILDSIRQERDVNILDLINPSDRDLANQSQLPQLFARINQQLDQSSSEEYIQNATDEQLRDIVSVCGFYFQSYFGNFINQIGNNIEVAPQDLEGYRQHLKNIFTTSIAEVYNDPSIVIHLADPDEPSIDPVQSGRESIVSFAAHCVTPLLHYAQLKELQQAIRCPENTAQIPPNRRRDLNNTTAQLQGLSNGALILLKKRLLGLELTAEHTQGFSESEIQAIQDLHRQICALAAPLVQGRLVTQRQGLNNVNLFQGAWQEFARGVN